MDALETCMNPELLSIRRRGIAIVLIGQLQIGYLHFGRSEKKPFRMVFRTVPTP